ncbi:MAG: hypothetical protein KDD89_10710 [Anaerolineales bacterium]|nr:hypothetical protein [Anaerolineales bacterium]
MSSNLDFSVVPTELSAPIYLRLRSAPFANTPLSIREHLTPFADDGADLPVLGVV